MARILIVEDDAQVLALAKSILQDANHDTLSASTVTEALAVAQSGERMDLLFTDISLGCRGEGGLTMAQQVVQSRPGLPVLYTTGGGMTNAMIALFVEPSAFLGKPYTGPMLIKAVSELLKEGGPTGAGTS